jgi:hypothetical protein
MMEDDEMSGLEKSKLPYVLLLDRVGQRAAAYSNTHRLLVAMASAELIAFAEANPAIEAPWSETLHRAGGFEGRELPAWATAEVRAKCVMLWIKRGNAPDAYWRSIPRN